MHRDGRGGAPQDFLERKDSPAGNEERNHQAVTSPYRQELCQALQHDLHKHPAETYAVLNEIQEHLDYLDDWAATQSVATNIICQPGASSIVPEPLGVVQVFSTWNYPIYLILQPLSAGNCALVHFTADGSVDATNALLASLFDNYLDRGIVRYAIGGLDVSKEAALLNVMIFSFVREANALGKLLRERRPRI
ncbi:hypothetical protein AC1031_015383 [Aphanomyces cochlioides]|nr:hypothetical protein AC1031_015383 [Aphanomyces cochlioides]